MDLEDNKKLLYNKLLSNNYFINKNNSKAYIKCLNEVVDQVFDLKVTSIRDVNLYSLELIRTHFGLYDNNNIVTYNQLATFLNTYIAKVAKMLRSGYYELKKTINNMSKNLIIKEMIKEGLSIDGVFLKDTGLDLFSVDELEHHSLLTLGNLLTYSKEELLSMLSNRTYLDCLLTLEDLGYSLKDENTQRLIRKN